MFATIGPHIATPVELPANTQAVNDARYRWMREAFVTFDEEGFCNTGLEPLGLCQTEEEVDAAIDAELAKAGASNT